MNWLKEEGFGGVMIWSVDMDDFRGSCGAGKYPLIKAMKKELQNYKVKLEYEGPYESNLRNGKYTTKDRKCKSIYICRKFYKKNNILIMRDIVYVRLILAKRMPDYL